MRESRWNNEQMRKGREHSASYINQYPQSIKMLVTGYLAVGNRASFIRKNFSMQSFNASSKVMHFVRVIMFSCMWVVRQKGDFDDQKTNKVQSLYLILMGSDWFRNGTLIEATE